MMGCKMQVYFLNMERDTSSNRNASLEKRIRKSIPDLISINKIEDAAASKDKSTTYILFAASAPNSLSFDRFIRISAQYGKDVFFILISDDISAADYKRLVRSGNADWVSTERAPEEILEIFEKRRNVAHSISAVHGRQTVAIAFVPCAGGVGNSTLIAEVGVQFSAAKIRKERTVCAVDLDLQTSHICDYLDIEPRLQIQEVSADPERLDAQLFDIFVSHHSSGLDVFAAPRSKFNMCGLQERALDALFDKIVSQYDLIMLDLPVTSFPWSTKIIANCDAVLVTTINTVPGLRQVTETLSAIRSYRVNAGPVAVIVNRCERTILGGIARSKHVKSVLGHEKVFLVGHDPAFVESTNTGRPLALTSRHGRTARELSAIREFCAEIKPVGAASGEAADDFKLIDATTAARSN